MKTTSLASISSLALTGALLSALSTTSSAHAEDDRVAVQAREGNPSAYSLEIEPHFAFGTKNVYGDTGFGAGIRISIPVLAGHLGSVPQNLAISLGGDLLHYENCYYGNYCGANYLMIPVAAQWNLHLARRFSLLIEGGAFVYKGWLSDCGPGDDIRCRNDLPSESGVLPTLAVGGRVHFSDNAAFTFRVGYPTSTLGVSFM